MTLSILIPTIEERETSFNELVEELGKQINENGYSREIEIVSKSDSKEISIGKKRQQLLEVAKGDYVCQIDDDDFPYDCYIKEIMNALKQSPDCVGFLVHVTQNGGNPQTACYSLKYKKWEQKRDGFFYVRNVNVWNPVRRELALKVGFKDLRVLEDKDYADRLTPLCKTEVFIDKKLIHYRYSDQTPPIEKYGYDKDKK